MNPPGRNDPCPCGSGRKYKKCCFAAAAVPAPAAVTPALRPDAADRRVAAALALHRAGRLREAETEYRRALEMAPTHVDALHLLGMVLHESARSEAAVELLTRALAIQPDNALIHYNLGTVQQSLDRQAEAALCYRRALSLDTNFPEAHNNLGNALRELGRLAESAAAYRQALALRADFIEALNNLANLMTEVGEVAEAEMHYRRVLALQPAQAAAHDNLGNLLRGQEGRRAEAIALYRRTLELAPDFHAARANLLRELQHLCDWREQAATIDLLRRVVRKAPASVENRIEPFGFLAWPGTTAAEQRRCAENWVAVKFAALRNAHPQALHDPARPGHARLRIGYLSADLHEHATAHLMVRTFELHDRERFEVFAYSWGPDDGSAMRARLRAAFDRFVEIGGDSAEAAARRIAADEVDILVDLKGYTFDTRSEILALRPAPIQVNYLGYPGTMGADFVDYLIADRFIVPPEHFPAYTEKLLWLPDCYQPTDAERQRPPPPTRAACGLPQQGVVFCCFNQTYKITPEVFALWCRLLLAVPGSVLWLLANKAEAADNLRREAVARGVEAARIVMAPMCPPVEHLARLQLADLCLDTTPYNAHTTCSDALWMGVPVITCPGETFASRVAGSLLTALGMPELITADASAYYDLALALATDAALREAVRAKIRSLRETAPLFDSRRFTRNLEAAYATMWAQRESGTQGREAAPAARPAGPDLPPQGDIAIRRKNPIEMNAGPKDFVFTITTGRSGTEYLAELLAANLPDAEVHHEQLGFADWGVNTPEVAQLMAFNHVGNNPTVQAFWAQKLARVAAVEHRWFVETSHVLAKAGLIENLDRLQGAGRIHLIYLKRDIARTVVSFLNRGDFVLRGHQWLWYLDWSYPNVIVGPEPFQRLGQIGQALWYVIEMRVRAEAYRLLLAERSDVVFHTVDMEQVVRPEGATALLAALGQAPAAGSLRLPGRVNANAASVIDAAGEQRIRELVAPYVFDEREMARAWVEHGNRLGSLSA